MGCIFLVVGRVFMDFLICGVRVIMIKKKKLNLIRELKKKVEVFEIAFFVRRGILYVRSYL